MPCFLMDLRFATGKQQKNWTFRFFSGAALSLHVRSKSLGCQTAQIGTGTVFPAPLPLCGVLPQQWVRCSVFASCNAVRNIFFEVFPSLVDPTRMHTDFAAMKSIRSLKFSSGMADGSVQDLQSFRNFRIDLGSIRNDATGFISRVCLVHVRQERSGRNFGP